MPHEILLPSYCIKGRLGKFLKPSGDFRDAPPVSSGVNTGTVSTFVGRLQGSLPSEAQVSLPGLNGTFVTVPCLPWRRRISVGLKEFRLYSMFG